MLSLQRKEDLRTSSVYECKRSSPATSGDCSESKNTRRRTRYSRPYQGSHLPPPAALRCVCDTQIHHLHRSESVFMHCTVSLLSNFNLNLIGQKLYLKKNNGVLSSKINTIPESEYFSQINYKSDLK